MGLAIVLGNYSSIAIEAYRREVFAAHYRVAMRGNVSGEVLLAAYQSNGQNFSAAVMAAMATLGGVHGPLQMTQDFLESNDLSGEILRILRAGGKAPGWGNSFVKGKPDPEWAMAHERLMHTAPTLYERIDNITTELHSQGIRVYPNPSCYTACLSILMGLPSNLAVSLFLEARIGAWRKAVQEIHEGGCR